MKREGVFLISIFVILSVISFIFDKQIIQYFELIRNNFLNEFFLGITFLSSEIIIFFFLTSLFLWKERKRQWILPLWISLLASVIISYLMKIIIKRPRPFQLGIVSTFDILRDASLNIWNFSMPSFQAMLAFSALPILSKEFPKFKYVWILFALLIAVSRVYFGVHFFSDVVIGSFIGLLIGMAITRVEQKTGFGEKAYKKVFGKK